MNLVPYEYVWSYNQEDQPLDSTWITEIYDDSAWPSGPGLLNVEGSSLPVAKNIPLALGASTYYFRTQFTVDQDPSKIVSLSLYTMVDDGAIIYLNGQETVRIGVQEGNITHGTFTHTSVGNDSIKGPFDVEATRLRPGINTLAAEVHQTGSMSSDIVFGLQLDARTDKE